MSAFLPNNAPRCGAQVYDCHDPRHIGRLDSITHRYWVNITWPNGWKSTIPLHRVRVQKVETEE